MEIMCVYRYSLNLSVTFEIKHHLNSDPQTFAELLSVLRNLFFYRGDPPESFEKQYIH